LKRRPSYTTAWGLRTRRRRDGDGKIQLLGLGGLALGPRLQRGDAVVAHQAGDDVAGAFGDLFVGQLDAVAGLQDANAGGDVVHQGAQGGQVNHGSRSAPHDGVNDRKIFLIGEARIASDQRSRFHRGGQRTERGGAMRDLVFFIHRQFGHGLFQAGQNEEWVVPKTSASAWHLQNISCAFAALHDLDPARQIDEGGGAPKPCLTSLVRHSAQGLQQFCIVACVVARLAGIARGPHARRAVQCVHLQPGIVGDRRQPCGDCRLSRLGQSVALKRDLVFPQLRAGRQLIDGHQLKRR
jgi:hypothetical protein